ncbi:Spy0128 family protein [Peptoniphilus gorbachii]|uniref:Pilin isopeptide linkage protein/LPXTG-motif cell wall-anchored protein n=1 Tax=Peptoniphilus gorbachii TaxID=411567 RepID=A0ABS2MHU7_9FIRM|nr:FctA domain-containing protein [Peptoniphilus gorbachii]MBM7549603.1 pilin isopeptide linkage protein/LPXTG-motif cell wall-anchored protein [Peptoniphilus gorbachii]
MFGKNINITKRISAFLLALIMLIGALPLNVFAEGSQGKTANPIVIDSNTISEDGSSGESKDPTTGPTKHTISFNPNGGTGDMKSVEVAEGEEYSLPKNKFKAPEGKEFKNWLMDKEELKEGHKLVVTKDIELKANWKDVKVNPVKKALNSLIGKDDKEELDISNVNVGDAVMAGNNTTEGDPEGTVTSKDGKTRITNFEVSWSGLNADTIRRSAKETISKGMFDYGNVIRYEETPLTTMKLQVNWAISGERFYEPGMVRLKVPSYILFDTADGSKSDVGYRLSGYPVPEMKINSDGSYNYNADYGKATFAYVDDKENNTTYIINTKKLAPGNSGTYTIDYGYLFDGSSLKYMLEGNVRKIKDGSIAKIEPSIEVVLDNNEKLEKVDKKLYVEQDLSSEVRVKKFGKFYESWQDEWGTVAKPENDKDYWYVAYEIQGAVNSHLQKSKIVIEDLIENDQEIVALAPLKKIDLQEYIWQKKDTSNYAENLYGDYGLTGHKLLSAPEEFKAIKDVNDKDYETVFDYDSPRRYKDIDIFGMYVIAKVDYKKLGLGEKGDKYESHRFNNTAKATMYPLNSDDGPKTDEAIAYAYYEYTPPKPTVNFTAPPGDKLSLNKRTYLGPIFYKDGKYNDEHNFTDKISKKNNSGSNYAEKGIPGDFSTGKQPSSLYKNIFGEDLEVRWRIDGSARMANQTYDSSVGDKDNKDAYGKKKYKLSLTDEYLYLADDYTKELNSEDYELKNLTLSVQGYKYDQYDQYSKYEYRKSTDEIIGSLYLKKDSDSKWEKVANVKFKGYEPWVDGDNTLVNVEPIHEGVTSSKYGNYGYTMIHLPKGYSHVKLDVETNLVGLDMSLRPTGVLKMTSPSVKKYIEDSKTDEYDMDIMLRNDGTLAAYSGEGNLVGIHGTSKRDGKIDRTLDLDLQNYGSELYHDSSYIVFRNKPAPKLSFSESLNKKIGKSTNNTLLQRFEIPVSLRFSMFVGNKEHYKESEYMRYESHGKFYDLLPLGVTGIKDLKILKSNKGNDDRWNYRFYNTKDKKVSFEIIENWHNSGRNMLVIDVSGLKLGNKNLYAYSFADSMGYEVLFDMIYPWDSYKDFGPELKNIVAYESGSDINNLYSGLPDKPDDETIKKFKDYNIEQLTDLNLDHNEKRFYYAADKTSVSGNTIANTGLTKFVKDSKDPAYSLKTTTKEGGSYSYNIRLQAIKGTSVNDLIFYDSIENYKLLKTDADFGVKRWRGTLDSIDVNHAITRGANPKVYISKIDDLQIQSNQNLKDSNVWTLYKKGDDLSDVKAVAIDLREKPDGSPFKLGEEESISVTLHMKAPWNVKEHNIDSEAKAINDIYANTTVTTVLDDVSKHKLINTAYTAVDLKPVTTETQIKATKKHLDKEGKDIALKGDDFKFELRDSNNKVLQTKTNDNKGNITFDPIKYNSWDVGEYTYKIVEVNGDSETTAYDSHEEIVKVKVERSGDSELKATTTYDKDGAAFNNHEVDTITASLEAKKVYIGKGGLEEKPKAGAFEFILKDAEGKEVAKATNDAEGKVVFEGLEFKPNQIGEHKYTIEEVKGKDPTIEYDNTKKNVTINVSLTKDFKLKADVVYDKGETPTFTNTLKSASLQLVKLKDGSDPFILDEVKDKNGILTSYKVPEAQKDSVLDGAEYKLYKLTEGKEELVATLVTKNGISQVVQDIMPGKYKLKETKAPKGYTLNDKDLIFDITDKDAGTIVAKFATDDGIIDMPSTGGQGTKALMIGGGILVAVMTGALVVANKKKKEELNK